MTKATTTTNAASGSSLLDQARAAMPGMPQVLTAIGLVDEALREGRARQVGRDVVEDTLAALMTGKGLPVDLGEQARAVQAEVEIKQARAATLQKVAERLRQERRDLQVDGADAGLAVLAAALEKILTGARKVFTDLGPVGSAQDAINADVVPAWQLTGPLVARYGELRHVQTMFVAAVMFATAERLRFDFVTPEATRLVDTFGTVRNYAEMPPGQAWSGSGQITAPVVQIRNDAAVEYRASPTRTPPWLTDDPIANLRWLVSPAAQPWVPTIGELQAASEAAARQVEEQLDEANPHRRQSLMSDEGRVSA